MLTDGLHDVPAGKVAEVVTSLEMLAPPPLRPEIANAPWRLSRLQDPNPDEYLALYRAVGTDWLWFTRLVMPQAELLEALRDPAVEIYRLEAENSEVGFLELDFREAQTCELTYFGVSSGLIGGGAARWMMNRAIQRAWSAPIQRVWVHTCTLDHPAALRFYQKLGFIPYERRVEISDDPRLDGRLDPEAAPDTAKL